MASLAEVLVESVFSSTWGLKHTNIPLRDLTVASGRGALLCTAFGHRAPIESLTVAGAGRALASFLSTVAALVVGCGCGVLRRHRRSNGISVTLPSGSDHRESSLGQRRRPGGSPRVATFRSTLAPTPGAPSSFTACSAVAGGLLRCRSKSQRDHLLDSQVPNESQRGHQISILPSQRLRRPVGSGRPGVCRLHRASRPSPSLYLPTISSFLIFPSPSSRTPLMRSLRPRPPRQISGYPQVSRSRPHLIVARA